MSNKKLGVVTVNSQEAEITNDEEWYAWFLYLDRRRMSRVDIPTPSGIRPASGKWISNLLAYHPSCLLQTV